MTEWNKIIGPGILFAATAIGVSHLVQSTTAGALFGLSMIGFVALANILKFPFFEYGSRYAAATGTSIIEGYYKLNKVWLYVYLLITFVSMFFVTAAVGAVTIGFMENLFGINEMIGFQKTTHFLLFFGCTALLMFGRFNLMEKLIKILGIVLLLTTIISFVAALFKGPASTSGLFPPLGDVGWAFLLPLMGWMPTAIDLSAWNSLWTVEKIKQTGYKPSVKESVKEFSFGYWISATLAFFFLIMGALLVYNSGIIVPEGGVAFSGFVIALYTESIGQWAAYIVSIAAFSIMFSTFLTILDGYSRAITTSFKILSPTINKKNFLEKIILIIVSAGGLILILLFENNTAGFRMLVNTATTISFIVAPVIAVLNFRLVMSDKIGKENAPNKFMKILSWLGIFYLIAFLIWFLIT